MSNHNVEKKIKKTVSSIEAAVVVGSPEVTDIIAAHILKLSSFKIWQKIQKFHYIHILSFLTNLSAVPDLFPKAILCRAVKRGHGIHYNGH